MHEECMKKLINQWINVTTTTSINRLIYKSPINQPYNNIHNNLFTFCYRGGGNFSYRFYETLMMGRIPLLINTHCIFPFPDKINIHSIALVINEDELDFNNLTTIIQNYYNNNLHNLLNIQQNNRYIWETYLSPHGFLNNII